MIKNLGFTECCNLKKLTHMQMHSKSSHEKIFSLSARTKSLEEIKLESKDALQVFKKSWE